MIRVGQVQQRVRGAGQQEAVVEMPMGEDRPEDRAATAWAALQAHQLELAVLEQRLAALDERLARAAMWFATHDESELMWWQVAMPLRRDLIVEQRGVTWLIRQQVNGVWGCCLALAVALAEMDEPAAWIATHPATTLPMDADGIWAATMPGRERPLWEVPPERMREMLPGWMQADYERMRRRWQREVDGWAEILA